jgi:hypothetical protein
MRYWSSITAGVREKRARLRVEGYLMMSYSQHVSGNASHKVAIGKSIRAAITKVCDTSTDPETFMTDSGPGADNSEVRKFCESRGINRLSSTSQDLSGRLKRLPCVPDLGEDKYDAMAVPENWPTHLDEAIRYLSGCILPLLKFFYQTNCSCGWF